MHNNDISLSFSNMKVCCVYLLESPHGGDSNEHTQHNLAMLTRKLLEIIPNSKSLQLWDFILLGTQERVQNSCDKRAIGVHPTEVLLYLSSGEITLKNIWLPFYKVYLCCGSQYRWSV